MKLFVAKWKKKIKPNTGKIGYYVGNYTYSTSKLEYASIFWSVKNAQTRLKNAFNLGKHESTLDYFVFLEVELKIKP